MPKIKATPTIQNAININTMPLVHLGTRNGMATRKITIAGARLQKMKRLPPNRVFPNSVISSLWMKFWGSFGQTPALNPLSRPLGMRTSVDASAQKNGGEEGILLGCFFVSCISLIWSALQDSLHLGRLRGVAEVQLLLVRIFSSHEPEKAKLNPTNSHGVVITRRAPAKELPHPVFEAETRPQNHVKFSHYFFFGLRFFHRTSAS